jgi:sulfonate transport system substrate-binding protein
MAFYTSGWRSSAICLGMAVALLLGACGPQQAEKPALRIGDQSKILQLPLDLSGEAAKLPFDAQWATFTDGPHMNAAFLADAIDIGEIGDTPALLAGAARADVVIIGAARVRPDGFSRLFARPGTGIKTLADLKGMRIAYTKGTAGHGSLLLALDSVGLKSRDVVLVDVPGVSTARTLQAGSVDAAMVGGALALTYPAANPGTVAIKMPFPFFATIAVSRKALADPGKKALVREYIAATARAMIWLDRNGDRWGKDFYGKYQHQDPAVTKLLVKRTGTDIARFRPVDPELVAQLRSQSRLLAEAGVIPRTPDPVEALLDPAVAAEFKAVFEGAAS